MPTRTGTPASWEYFTVKSIILALRPIIALFRTWSSCGFDGLGQSPITGLALKPLVFLKSDLYRIVILALLGFLIHHMSFEAVIFHLAFLEAVLQSYLKPFQRLLPGVQVKRMTGPTIMLCCTLYPLNDPPKVLMYLASPIGTFL